MSIAISDLIASAETIRTNNLPDSNTPELVGSTMKNALLLLQDLQSAKDGPYYIDVSISNAQNLPSSPTDQQKLTAYLIGSYVYVWNGTAWTPKQFAGPVGEKGDKGDSGVTAAASVVAVSDYAAGDGTDATKVYVGTANALKNLYLYACKLSSTLNIDKLYPLANGYYTLATAIAAVETNLQAANKKIMFTSAAGVQETYQYTNIDVANWTTVANWEVISITGKYGNLGIITNLNTIARTGNYTAYGTAIGAPDTAYSWFIEHINSSAGTVTAYQRAIAYSTDNIVYERTKINSVWGTWNPLIENVRSQNTNSSPSSKLFDDELKNVQDSIFDKEYSSLFYGHDDNFGGSSIVTDNTWVELNAATKSGILKTFKIPNFTGTNYNAKIVIIGADYKIKSITDVVLSGVTSNLLSYNISISIGDYVGFYSSSITSMLKYKGLTGYSLAKFSNTPNIGESSQMILDNTIVNYYYELQYYELIPKFDELKNSIFDKEYSSLFYGHDDNFGGSSLVIDGTWVELNAVTKNGILETFKIPNFSGTNYNAKIVVVGQDLRIKSITDVILSGVTSNLSSYNIEVSIGDYVGFYSSSITSILNYKTLAGCSCISYSTSPNIGDINQGNPPFALNYYYEIKSYSLVSKFEQNLKKLSYNESNSLVITGSSLSESLTTPNGMGWIERLNDIMDIPIVNAGVGGRNLIYNMNMLANDIPLPHDSENTIKECNPQYIMWLNSANGTPIGEDAIKQLRVANMLTKTLGAKMIVGTEEYWPDYDWRHEGKSISFGEMENIPYSTLSKLSKMLYPSYVYPGFEYGNHSGYRAQSVYLAHYDNLLYSMTPKQAIKAYRVRPLFKGGSPTISELSYNDNIDRWKKYYSISAGNGTNFTPTTGGIDNLDNHTYDVANGVNTGILTTETSVLIRGGELAFSNYALLEFILKDINIDLATVSFNCSVIPDNVYILRKKESSLTENTYTEPATEFESLNFGYTNGIVTIQITDNIQCYDKISLLIKKAGTFNIGSPEISYYGGVEKDMPPLKKVERKFGIEQQTYHDMTNGGWALNGNAVLKSFPTEIAQYPAYNSANSHIELPDDSAFITKNINVTQPCTKVAVRVVAQNFIKIATTRYNDNSDLLNSGYINNSGPQITPYDYDYGELYIKTTRGFLIKKIVMPGWTECYVEIPVYPDDSVIQLEIGRTNHIDSNYSNENSILMINDISVQKI
jgi:hypothetical protein